MTRTLVLGSHIKALSTDILELYRAKAQKNSANAKIFGQATFHQAVALLGLCYQVTFSEPQLQKMRKMSFRNSVLILPLEEARLGTSRAVKLEFHIEPSERMIFLARYGRQKTTRLHVKVEESTSIHIGYKLEVLRRLSDVKSSVLQESDDQDVFAVDTYADFDTQGRFQYGKNFPKRDFDIRELVAKICDLRIEA